MSILVTGARGAVGRAVLDGLLAAGTDPADVRAGGRDPDALAVPTGVTPVAADLDHPEGIDLDGVEQVFCYLGRSLDGFAAAASAAGVAHVVLLSSEAVVQESGGVIEEYHAAGERALRGAGLLTTALRPGAFAGNARWWAAEIRETGVVTLGHPRAGLAPIDERDIADVAVAALTSGAGRGESPHLTGPESMTFAEQIDVLARELDREIGVREIDPAEARERMARHTPREIVDSIFDYTAKTEGRPAPVTDEVPRLAGHPGRPFAQWVREHRDEF